MIAARASVRIEFSDDLGQSLVGLRVAKVAGNEPDALGQLLPHLFTERRAGMFADGVVDDLGEVLILPVTPGKPHEGEAGRKQATVGKVIDGRHDLLAGKVACDAEEHHAAGSGNPGETLIKRIAQWVRGWRHALGRAHAPSMPAAEATVARNCSQDSMNFRTPSRSSCSHT